MAIPELDLKKVSLQAAVGYLISLHDNEVDWNLLGIKVIGAVPTAEDIPEGTYEYGDAYMVGTETPYDMYIYTRPDGKVHTEGYWFPIGKFPMPGPQGPKGDGWETAQLFQEGITTNLNYDSTNGGKNESISSMTYVDSTTGQRLTKNFQMVSRLPIIPGKYVSMAATEDNKKIEVKVDDTALALDYYKITKGPTANVPAYSPTNGITTMPYSYQNTSSSLVRRGLEGEAKFSYGIFSRWNDLNSDKTLEFSQVNRQVGAGKGIIEITTQTSDEGTMSILDVHNLKICPQLIIVYRGKAYYRMDPIMPLSDTGIVNFVHLDSIEDGNGGYKATGKCFNLNLGSRAWKVFDLDFGGSTPAPQATEIYRHGIVMYGSPLNIYIDIYDSNSATYTYSALKTKLANYPSHTAVAHITGEDGTHISAALVRYNTSLDNYKIMYNNIQNQTTQVDWTPTQVVDNGTEIYHA